MNPGTLKKLRKKAQRGGINTKSLLASCLAHEIIVRPRITLHEDIFLRAKVPTITAKDIRQLIFHILLDEDPCSWVKVANKAAVERVVVLTITGIDREFNFPRVGFFGSATPPLRVYYFFGQEPHNSTESILYAPDSEIKADLNRKRKRADMQSCWSGEERPPASYYLLTLRQMEEYDYPVPGPAENVSEKGSQQQSGVSRETINGAARPIETAGSGANEEKQTENRTDQNIDDNLSDSRDVGSDFRTVHAQAQAGLVDWRSRALGTVLPSLPEAEGVLSVLPKVRNLEGYVQTVSLADLLPAHFTELKGKMTDENQLFGLDCEMVSTKEGLELARVTVVSAEKEVLLDSYVKPRNPIVDYHTQFSGITKETLAHVDTRLEQVQVAMLRLIPSTSIIVGHSLENDLKVLKLLHFRCIDTSILYPHPRGPPARCALRVLSKKFLRRTIQNSSTGHNSIVDATAALDLALLKIKRGPHFATAASRHSLLEALGGKGVRCTAVAERNWLCHHAKGATSAVLAADWSQTVAKITTQAKCQPASSESVGSFIFGHGKDLSQSERDLENAGVEESKGIGSAEEEEMDAKVQANDAFLQETNILDYMTKMFKQIPEGTAMLLLTQPSLNGYRKLAKQKEACMDARSASVWTEEQDKQLSQMIDSARYGSIYLACK
mmetsp:Transcript_8916/g.11819  ORF Transcript_8916/g.11819 Transcript_8916/m.11819 type:complete len:668 (+) Transcript_8916:160-2163(+)|eukprot:CAMPEP_0117747560 /NCGR_PEP_ID=MMETSP0947-20121206/8577_1 /TAXON_ID=44440 /ORGANISM="Chattonella subsalsa, Strain CCMP2191" /LENGTH=667 /DNA_ID=CAMNT_0005565023 /DNA_START=112 /DNA_END=2115 /DNA_ORIENTATION=+